MLILSIESSCDETAAAVTQNGREVLADIIISQTDMHALYGGVVPELASRSHIQVIAGLADEALRKAGISKKDIEAVAVTYAPGLIGALLVGVNFAKAAALTLRVPLIPVHHIRGHIAANYIAYPDLEPPFLALVVSGGHSLIADVRGYTDMRVVGSTRDDAAGECFDKCARVLGLGYPGGKAIDDLAKNGDASAYSLPVGSVSGSPFDMSFSGLKTAAINIMHNAEQKGQTADRASIAASLSRAVSDSLVPRTLAAAEMLGYDKIAAAGGVAANSRLRADLDKAAKKSRRQLFMPPLSLCGDNAAMIGCQGYYEYLSGKRAGADLNAYATMELDKLR